MSSKHLPVSLPSALALGSSQVCITGFYTGSRDGTQVLTLARQELAHCSTFRSLHAITLRPHHIIRIRKACLFVLSPCWLEGRLAGGSGPLSLPAQEHPSLGQCLILRRCSVDICGRNKRRNHFLLATLCFVPS